MSVSKPRTWVVTPDGRVGITAGKRGELMFVQLGRRGPFGLHHPRDLRPVTDVEIVRIVELLAATGALDAGELRVDAVRGVHRPGPPAQRPPHRPRERVFMSGSIPAPRYDSLVADWSECRTGADEPHHEVDDLLLAGSELSMLDDMVGEHDTMIAGTPPPWGSFAPGRRGNVVRNSWARKRAA